MIRNVREKRPKGEVFLDVAKPFDTVWIYGLLYKVTILNFPSYLVKTISSYLRGRTFEASFKTATSSRCGMQAGMAKGRLFALSFSVCILRCFHLRTTWMNSLRERHDHHCHDTQEDDTLQLPGGMYQRHRAVPERTYCHERLEEERNYLRDGCAAFPEAPTVTAIRGTNPMARHIALPGGYPRHTANLVASYRSGEKETC
jgi:hypothetical protein